MSAPVRRPYVERPTGPRQQQNYNDTSSEEEYSDSDYEMPADHVNDYPIDHEDGAEGSLHDIEQGPVEDVIDTKQEEIYPIQLYFEDVRYAVPIQKKKKKTNEQGGGFFRRKKKTANMETTDQKQVQEAHQQPAVQPPTSAPVTAPVPEDKKGKKKKKDKQKKNVEYRYLLKGVTGVVNPGTLLAIMGSSGAGKTTLLNILAGRKDKGSLLEGKILLNGNDWDKAKPIRKHIAYIMQDDIIMKTQTPKEVFMFSARLKVPKTVMKTDEERMNRVDHLINQLGLQRSQNTQVGAPGEKRGISGGERKRVSIGSELVGNPSLLFVDEPTSGLDTFTAESVMKVLRDLAKGGRTVITTIHQPNSYIFGLFDQLMLMSAGEVVYYGPANQAHVYFSRLGYELPPRVNPADFFVKLIHVDPLSEQSKQRNAGLIEAYKDSDLYQKLRSEMQVTEVPIVEDENVKKSKRDYARGPGAQISILLKRSFQDVYREPLKIRASLISNVIIALLIGLIFLQIGNTQADIQSKLGALFFIVLNQTFSSVTGIVNLFPAEKALFLREHGNNMYRTTAFYIAKIIADLPMQIASPLVFGTIAYFMIGFKTNGVNFLLYIIVVILVANIGSALGLTLGIVAKDAGTASALIPMIVLPFVIFSGFFVNNRTVPKYFIWVPPISFVRYAFSAVVLNEFQGQRFRCTSSELIRVPGGGAVCQTTRGEQQIEFLDFQDDSIAVDIVVLAAYYVGLRIIGWFALLWRARQVANA